METRQLVRWSVPSSILFLTLGTLHGCLLLACGEKVDKILAGASLISTTAVAVVVASGIPLGFIIYQLYFYLAERGINLGGKDLRWKILKYLPEIEKKFGEIQDFQVIQRRSEKRSSPSKHRGDQHPFENANQDPQRNWDCIRFWLLYRTAIYKDDPFRQEINNLADLYHGLGAMRISLLLAFVIHAVVEVTPRREAIRFEGWLSLGFSYLVLLFVWGMLDSNRIRILNSMGSVVIYAEKFKPCIPLNPTTQADC